MKAPWFPFYTGDFLASPAVQDMEAHEVGAYVLLLARSWQSDTPGYIEDDDYGMRKAARLSADMWAQSKTGLLKKWPLAEDKPGYRFNPRLLKEAEKQVELREKKSEAGQRSAAKREEARLEAERKATERQQSANTIPTPVEIPATDDGENGNYSQPQPQPQEDKSSTTLRSVTRTPKKEPEHFEAFWLAYPRKENRTTALKAFEKLTAGERAAAPQAARDWFARRPPADWFKADGTDVRPHPTTWLNQKRWTDLTEVTITQPLQTEQAYGNPQRNAVQRNGITFANDDKRRASLNVIAGIKWGE